MNLERAETNWLMDFQHINDDREQTKSGCPIRLEDLSNELIYDIFDYLDGSQIYEIFLFLNARFQHLFTSSCFRLKLNFPLTSKATFLDCCTHLIAPNIDRIVSLSLSYHFMIRDLLRSFSIDVFIHLERLHLDDVPSDILLPFVTRLATLHRLVSLSIACSTFGQDENAVYRCIFRLPTLKYCQLNISIGIDKTPFPYALEEEEQCRTLEYLIIDGYCRLDQLIAILTYTPRLTHLSCHLKWERDYQVPEKLTVSPYLTHVALYCGYLPFRDFEEFLARISRRVQRLRVTSSFNHTYLCADRWEQLISCHMPHLRIFDFQHFKSDDDFTDDNERFLPPLDRFRSAFWRDRHWFLAYQSWPNEDNEYLTCYYSIRPYRRKHYELNSYVHDQDEIELRSPSHLTIGQHAQYWQRATHCPNVTKLTLFDSISIKGVNRIVPLAQLSHLNITDEIDCIDSLIELLWLSPNIHSLTLIYPSFRQSYPLSVKYANMARRISKKNKITELIIRYGCTLESIHLFLDLCPRLQHLDIGIDENELEPILRYLLSNRASDLHSLSFLETDNHAIQQIQAIIERNLLLHDYIIKHHKTAVDLWW